MARIKLETCRYGLNSVPVEQRVCETCNVVEDEYHVIMDCKIYDDIRDRLFTEICGISFQFCNLPLDSQFLQIMSYSQFYRAASRVMYNILNRRRCNMLNKLLHYHMYLNSSLIFYILSYYYCFYICFYVTYFIIVHI